MQYFSSPSASFVHPYILSHYFVLLLKYVYVLSMLLLDLT